MLQSKPSLKYVVLAVILTLTITVMEQKARAGTEGMDVYLPRVKAVELIEYTCSHHLYHISMISCISHYKKCMQDVFLREDVHFTWDGKLETDRQKVVRAYHICVIKELLE